VNNYIYFGFCFFVLTLLSTLHFFYLDQAPLTTRLFFFAYGIGQAILEVGAFFLLSRFFPRSGWFVFVLLLIHFSDFTNIHLMDAPISYGFHCFFGCGVDHFFATLQAIHLNLATALLILCTTALIPLIGMLFYKLTQRLSLKKPWNIASSQVVATLCTAFVTLLALEFGVRPSLPHSAYSKFAKTLPFGTTFFSPTYDLRSAPPVPFREEQKMHDQLAQLATSLEKRPNIYIWVVEAIRRDFVTPETAPNWTQFGERYGTFPLSTSNANATQLSWYAIFHSNIPYHWTATRDQWSGGSLPLTLLKQLGYKLHLYSAADLHYYQMDRLLFGKELSLIDHVTDLSSDWSLEPWQRDAKALSAFFQDLEAPDAREGNIYLFFMDGTHSEYSFPESEPLRFTPVISQINYLALTHTRRDLEGLKNRYRNAIFHIDSLAGQFLQRLTDRGLLDEAIVAFTADHGEEFFEEGSLFHGTHLNTVQTHVPLLMKLGNGPAPKAQLASHIDIFPTIFHFLLEKAEWTDLFDGVSLFNKNSRSHLISVMQNTAQTPTEFILQNLEEQIPILIDWTQSRDMLLTNTTPEQIFGK
jgi:hypothetical protein